MTILEIPLVGLAQLQASGGTTVGGATAVATDDGEASYISVAYGTTFEIGGSFYADSTSDAWSGTLAPADIPAGATIDGASIRVTYRVDSWNNPTYAAHELFIASDPNALVTSPGTQPGTVYASDIADPTRATWVNLLQSATTWQTASNSLPAGIDAATLRTGGLPLWLYEKGNTTAPTNTVLITEVVAVIAYTAAMTAPPLRQFPRTDGLATSSARRLWPPSRSRQRSNRRAGGYL